MWNKLTLKVIQYLFKKSSSVVYSGLCKIDETGNVVFSKEVSTDRLVDMVVGLLGKSTLTLAQRNILNVQILDSLHALPLKEIFSISEDGQMLVRGISIDYNTALRYREYANSALSNPLLNLIREQVAYQAIAGGIHKCVTPEDLYFYRAALWYGQQLDTHLKAIAGREIPQV